jgi:tetratricopeptide (TPR) repeat protein
LTIDPPAAPHMSELANDHINRGQLLRELKRPNEAVAAYDQAIRWQQRVAALMPADRDQRRNYGKALAGKAVALRLADRKGEAMAALSDAVSLLAGDATALVAAAKEAAQLADGPDGRAADLAVKALRDAVRVGWKGRNTVMTDAAFAPIRDRADVRKLLGEK